MTENKCRFCNPEIDLTLEMTKPTLHQVNALLESTSVMGELFGCGEQERLTCEPLMRLQKVKDKIIKEIKQR